MNKLKKWLAMAIMLMSTSVFANDQHVGPLTFIKLYPKMGGGVYVKYLELIFETLGQDAYMAPDPIIKNLYQEKMLYFPQDGSVNLYIEDSAPPKKDTILCGFTVYMDNGIATIKPYGIPNSPVTCTISQSNHINISMKSNKGET